MRLRRKLVALSLLMLAAAASAGAAVQWQGLSLTDALDKLRDEGLPIVYSTSLVKPGMRVINEPRSQNPREVLTEILAAHGLDVRRARRGQLVVIRSQPPKERERKDPPTADPMVPPLLEEIVVTPSLIRLLQTEPGSRETLTKEEIDRLPHLGGDAFRAVRLLPGTGGADVSARFNVRGGVEDELMVVLDGFELYEPFHLKDFMSIFSTVDAAAVGGIDLLTAGFPVEYGDRMSGVMEMTSAPPSVEPSTAVSMGTINSHLHSSGRQGVWDWLLAARGWYPDLILGALDNAPNDLRTDYYDLFAKIQRPAGRSTIVIGALAAYDDLGFSRQETNESEDMAAEYDSQHIWANITTAWTDQLQSRSVIGAGDLGRERRVAKIEIGEGALAVSDERSFQFLSFKQDWVYQHGESQLFKGGLEVRTQRAHYDYFTESSFEGGIPLPGGSPGSRNFAIEMEPQGESYGAYLADRFRINDSLIAELGVRWDREFWNEGNQLSPRLQLRYEATPRTVARLAWGRYFQSQRLNELQVGDGVSEFFPAQLSEHWVGSVQHTIANGSELRLEAYFKDMSRLKPRYENLFSPLELFPEAQIDRILVAPQSATARGIEITARSNVDDRLAWWASYAWAKALDEIDGELVPRSWDQRHTINAGVNLVLPKRWNVNLGATWHTGWPTTGITSKVTGDPDNPHIELVPGPRNQERLPYYLRLDLRASRALSTRFGSLTFIAEILNFTNHRNVCCVDEIEADILEDGTSEVTRGNRYWAPITPAFSLRWRM